LFNFVFSRRYVAKMTGKSVFLDKITISQSGPIDTRFQLLKFIIALGLALLSAAFRNTALLALMMSLLPLPSKQKKFASAAAAAHPQDAGCFGGVQIVCARV